MKSDKKKTEAEILVDQLRVENELKTKWLSLIAHDFKGLFSNIQFLLNALENNSISNDVFISMIPELKQTAEKNAKTLETTFAWVNAQKDGFNPHIESVHIHNLFQDIVQAYDKDIAAKALTLEFVGDKNLKFYSDSFLLRFILKEVIENAIKYSYKETEIEMIVQSDIDKVTLTIKDSGKGMKSSQLETIGTLDGAPYTGTMQEKGAGLSLVVVKEFVEILGGQINIDSAPKEGSSVVLRFPIWYQKSEVDEEV